MLRTQPIGVKNAKKSQMSPPNVNVSKAKGTKSVNSDKKSRASVSDISKSGVKSVPTIKVQGQSRSDNVTHMPLNPSRSNQMVDYADRTLERSKSFFLTRKLSKIYDSLTNSKENLKDNNDSSLNTKTPTPTPLKFIRSVSLAAISLKKDYRNSMRKPKLEQLSEEDHPFDVPIEKTKRKNGKKSKTASVDSLSSRTSEKSSVISSFKRTFSLTPSRRKSSNPKWSASLMSLQQIDVMISYEDWSFIDYDKFNTYEENLMNKIKSSNQINDVYRPNTERFPGVKLRPRSTNDMAKQRRHSTVYQPTIHGDYDTANWLNDNPNKRWSNPCIVPNTEYTSFPSYASAAKVQSSLGVDECDCSASTNCLEEIPTVLMMTKTTTTAATTKVARSVDDLTGKSNEKTDLLLRTLKSKSLTHLDSLEPHNLMQNSVFPSQHTEVNHSNFFRIYFDLNAVNEKEELLPAVKGATLGHVLNELLLRRNLSISQLAIYELPGTSDLRTPLTQLSHVNDRTDTGTLAGKHLIITEQDEAKVYHPTLRKVSSFQQSDAPRPIRLYSSASAEEATESSHNFDTTKSTLTTVKPSKPRWSTLFGQKNPHQGQLCEILNSYAKNGVPQSKAFSSFEHSDFVPSLQYINNIHGSWKEFVNVSNMKEHEIKIQSAIWELVTTEVDYIHALQTVTELFLSCLEAIQSNRILTDIDQSKLFSNIREICEVNIKFWTLYLYPMVQNSIQTGAKMCIDYFRPGFENFSTIFSPYKIYCAEQSQCQYTCKELNASNTLFTSYLAWCEAQKLCNRLRLADILVRPTQRLTKYGLLLGAIRKHVVDENDAESLDLMIHCVESFVFGVNTHLTMRQENERLKGIMARIESYDVVDTNNENLEKLLKQHCSMFDLCGPMKGCATPQERHLFMEGDLRYKDSTTKVDVHCFLLTDLLLICKPIAKKGMGNLKVIRQPFLTDRLKIAMKENTLYLIYLNDWELATSAFTLQCSEARNWFDAFTKAKHIYSRLKQSSPFDSYNIRYHSTETLGIRKSPLNSSMGSRLSSLNNSHSGSVELNDSRNISMDYEKASSLSSDESMQMCSAAAVQGSSGPTTTTNKKLLQYTPSTKYRGTTPNTLLIQPFVHLGQSLPNLNLNASQTINNTLLVPGTSSGHSNLLSPSQRGISYPPPSPTRAILRRGFAFSASIKNPPLLKSRNIQSQSSITANVPVPLIGGAQPVITTPQTTETTVQIKDTSKLQYHTSITGPTTNHQQQQQQQPHTQVQQKLSNESIDLSCSNQNPQPKNEHIV